MASRPSNLLSLLARSWFPMALIGLVLLGVPGLVLFVLNLFGAEAPVNRWLQGNFKLSYHIPLPWWAVLALVFVPCAIVLLYFLKLKRKPLSVPSTFLWRKSIEDLHVNSLFQWLRENVLLLLQILAVLALIYGVMAFHLHGRTGQGKHYILMIDNSASMAATDVSPSRLEVAKREALQEIDSYSDDDFGMLIVFNSSAEIRQSYTSNRAELRRAVERIEQTQRPTRIEEALSLADSLSNPVRSTEDVASRPEQEEPGKERTYVPPQGMAADVHLFSDGRFPELSEATLGSLHSRMAGNESPLGNLNLHFHVVGKPGPENVDNVAIVDFGARRDEEDPTRLRVFVRAMNFRSENTKAQLELEIRLNGQVRDIAEKELSLPARKVTKDEKEQAILHDQPGEGAATFVLPDLDDRSNAVLRARLADVHDNFPLDDEAYLALGAVRKARVLIVGKFNEVLHAFFDDQATRQVATVKQLAPEDLDRDTYLKDARSGAYDLVIFDRCAPKNEESMPRANTFFIGYPPPPWKLESLEKVLFPAIKGWINKHAVLRYLTALYEVGIREAFKMNNLPPRTPRLIESDSETPLLLTLNRESFTDLVMTFSIINEKDEYNTDWPGKTSFPLFLRNVLYALGNISDVAAEATVQPGQVKILRPEIPTKRITVQGPDGKPQTLSHEDRDTRTEFPFADTDRIGVYKVDWAGGAQSHFAVNLLDEAESNIEPRTTLQIGSEKITAGQEISQPREVWPWFAGLALLVLLVEWYIYNRRVYI